MSESQPSPPVRRATSMLWRLLLLVPGLAMAGYGYYAYQNVPDDGVVNAIKLTTKTDIAGQTRDAFDTVDPGTADLYLIVRQRDSTSTQLPTFKDTPIGSGLTWNLPASRPLDQIALVEVWDHNAILRDKQLDRVEFKNAWAGRGQTFSLELQGTRSTPPPWALPLTAIGATLAGVVILKFIWDQAL